MGRHKNAKQEEVMVTFMEKHPEMANGFIKGKKVEIYALWEILTVELNKFGPPVRVCMEWKKTWTDWKGHVRRKFHDKGMDTSRSNLSNIRLTNAEETIVRLCRLNENVERKIEIKNPRSIIQNDDVVDDTSLINIILGEDQSNSSYSSGGSSSNSSLKRKRETSSQENLNDFLSSEISFQEDLKGFPSSENLIHKDLTKTLETFSESTQRFVGDSSACLKRISNILNDFCSLQAEKNKEAQRHNRVVEELMREKNMIKMRSLELQELKFKLEQEKLAQSKPLIKYEIE